MRSKAVALTVALVCLFASCAESGPELTRRAQRSDASEAKRRPSRKSRLDPSNRAEKKRPRVKKQPKQREPDKPKLTESTRGVKAYVSRVVDGDTIEVDLRGVETGVRLIGFDTPETVHPSVPVECFGRAASAYTTRKLQGREVSLEFDVERTDHYGRTLAYVWVGDGLFNERILRDGFAQVSTYPPNVKYVDRFLAAQARARERSRGLWSSCDADADEGGNGSNGSSGAGVPKKMASGGNCDPNYSGACVPSYPPDVDCPDVPAADFKSRGSDPHAFDGDGDGIACESY